MADSRNPGIMELLGYTSGMTALGVAGYEMFGQAGKQVTKRDAVNKIAGSAYGMKPKKINEISSLVSKTDMSITRAPKRFSIGDLADMKFHIKSINSSIYDQHAGFFNYIDEINKFMTSSEAGKSLPRAGRSKLSWIVKEEIGNNVSVSFSYGTKEFKLSTLTSGALYPMNTHGRGARVAPHFLLPEDVEALLPGSKIKTLKQISEMKVSINEMSAWMLLDELKSGEHNFSKINMFVNQRLVSIPHANSESIMANKIGARMVPLIRDQRSGRVKIINPNIPDEALKAQSLHSSVLGMTNGSIQVEPGVVLDSFALQTNNKAGDAARGFMNDVFDKNFEPFYGVSVDKPSGQLIRPDAIPDSYKVLGNAAKRSSIDETHSGIGSLYTYADTNEFYKNILRNSDDASIQAMAENTNVFDAVLRSGAADRNKLTKAWQPMKGLNGEEGVIISDKFAREMFTSFKTERFTFREGSTNNINQAYQFMDDSVRRMIERSRDNTFKNGIINNNVNLSGRIERAQGYITKMNDGDLSVAEDFQVLRDEIFREMATSGENGTIFSQWQQANSDRSILDSKGLRYKHGKIMDISLGHDNAYTVDYTTHTRFGKSLKFWGSMKENQAYTVENRVAARLQEINFSIAQEMLNESNPKLRAEKLVKILGYLNDGGEAGHAGLADLLERHSEIYQQSVKHTLNRKGNEIVQVVDVFQTAPKAVRGEDPSLIIDEISNTLSAHRINALDNMPLNNQEEFRAYMKEAENVYDKTDDKVLKTELRSYFDKSSSHMVDGKEVFSSVPSFKNGIFSTAGDLAQEGYSNHRMINLNSDVVTAYRNMGLTNSADYISGNFKIQERMEMQTMFDPLLLGTAPDPKNSVIIKQASVRWKPEDIDALVSGDHKQAMQTVVDTMNYEDFLATGKKHLNVSDKTYSLIDIAHKNAYVQLDSGQLVPVLSAPSNSYVGHVFSNKSKDYVKRDLFKPLSDATRKALTGMDPEAKALADFAGNLIPNANVFGMAHLRGGMLEIRTPNGLSEKDLNAMRSSIGNDERYLDILNKYGIKDGGKGLDSMPFVGVSDRTFANMVEQQIKVDNPVFDKTKINDVDGIFADSNFLKKFANTSVRERTAEDLTRHSQLMQKYHGLENGIQILGTRNPTGNFGGQAVNFEGLNRELNAAAGQASNVAARNARALSGDLGAHTTGFSTFLTHSDKDRDPFIYTVLGSKNKPIRDEVNAFIHGNSATQDIFNWMGSGKGIKVEKADTLISSLNSFMNPAKSGFSNDLAEKFISASFGEVIGIPSVSNRLVPIMNSLQNVDETTRSNPAFGQFVGDVLREQLIGAKELGAESVFDGVFSKAAMQSKTFDERVASLSESVGKLELFKGKDMVPYADAFKTMVNAHDISLNAEKAFYSGIQKAKLGVGGAQGYRNIQALLDGTEEISHPTVAALLAGRERSLSGSKRLLSAAGNISEGTFKKVFKNRAFQIAGGIALASVLLRPSDSHLQHQEVREESQPKRRGPAGASAIDPPTGAVFAPGSPGYKLSVRGKVPVGLSDSAIQYQMNRMGAPFGGSMVQRDRGVDSQYVGDLKRSNDSLLWNNS